MASLFRARRPDEGRSGGKILRGRRAAPPSSPYLRPQATPTATVPPPSPPPAAQSGSPRWLRGLISGAGKLISSVFRPEGSSQSPSGSEYSSEQEIGSSRDEEEDNGPSKEFHELDQRGNKSDVVWDHMEGSFAIIPKSESKRAIERLLMQETFSRDECNELTKLIQSRVRDLPSGGACEDGREHLPNRVGIDIGFPGTSRSNRNKKLSEPSPYSASNLNAFSPRLSLHEVHTPDECNKAVMEAKNWLQEKKLASSSKYDRECGPCSLNTDMLQNDVESEAGSPVDLAKSYMQSLPPWRYPSLGTIGFKTPPARGMHLYEDGTSYSTTVHSLPSSKVIKRDRIAIGAWDILDDTRRVRMKSIDTMLEVPDCKQIESSAKFLGYGSSKILSASDKEEPEEAANAVQATSASPTPTTNPMEAIPEKGSELKASNPDCLNLDDNQDVGDPSQTKEQVQNVLPHDFVVSAPTGIDNDGDLVYVAEELPHANKKFSVASDADGVANSHDAHTSQAGRDSGVDGALEVNSCAQLDPVSSPEEANCIADSRSQEGNDEVQNKVNGSSKTITTNGLSKEPSTNSDQKTVAKGATSSTYSGSGEPTVSISEGTFEPPDEAATANNYFTRASSSQNGTRMKSIERILTEPRPTTSRRGRKAVVKSRRGRKV